MPNYIYKCKSCGGHRETWHGMSDMPVIDCLGCHGDMEKVIQPVGIQFHGTGWAKDGYSNKKEDQ